MFYNIHVLSPVIDASNSLPHSHEDCSQTLPIRLPKMRNDILVVFQYILTAFLFGVKLSIFL